MSSVHIIGAGLAGLSAAVRLAASGQHVCMYEATGLAGGRCRAYHDPIVDRTIDNGNHLILEANRETFDFLDLIGARDRWSCAGETIDFIDLPTGKTWQLKPPFWMPLYSPLGWLGLLRLAFAGKNQTVAGCFARRSKLYRQFIDPIATATMNTLPEDASARLFRTLGFTLLRHGARSAMPFVPIRDLQDAIITPAIDFLKAHNVTLYFQHRLQSIELTGDKLCALQFGKHAVTIDNADRIILAVPGHAIAGLIPTIQAPTAFNPIINGHFIYQHARPAPCILALTGAMTEWIFFKNGIISTTTSAAGRFMHLSQDDIAEILWSDICAATGIQADMPEHRIVTEKRASFAATPAQHAIRAHTATAYTNLLLAGDHVQTGYPSTIEGAILSGHRAAIAALASA